MLQKPDICLTCPVPPLSLTSVKPPARCQPCRRTGFPSMVILPRQRARPAERRPPTLPKPICSRQDAFFRKARRCQVLLACLQPIGLKAAPNLKPPRALQPRAPGGCGDIAASPSCPCLAFIGALAGLHNWCAGRPAAQTSVRVEPSNPLELSAAPLFAVLFVAISIASTWAADHFGAAGLYVIAAIVGVTDIDPFVLGMLTGADAAVGVLTATASNNLLKAAYTVGWCWCRPTAPPVSGIARQHPRILHRAQIAKLRSS